MNKTLLFSILFCTYIKDLYCLELSRKPSAPIKLYDLFFQQHERNNAKALLTTWHHTAPTQEEKEVLQELLTEGADSYLLDPTAQTYAYKIEKKLESLSTSAASERPAFIKTTVAKELPILIACSNSKNSLKLVLQVTCILTTFWHDEETCVTT